MSKRISFTEFCANTAACLDQLAADRDELIVTRRGHDPVVILPLRELEGMRETLHLLSSPVNAQRLLRSIAEFDAGRSQDR